MDWRAIISAEQVSFCNRRTVVQDREGDIYESFCLLQPAVPDFVIRSHHDRKINASSVASLKTHIQSQCCQCRKRMAQMELRYQKVSLCHTASAVWVKKYPLEVDVYTVHVKEKPASMPHGDKPVEWTLYTSY